MLYSNTTEIIICGDININYLNESTYKIILDLKNAVFWDIMTRGSRKNQRFGGDKMFLWNAGSYKRHMVQHPRRWHSS
jgi:hypothetical protein